MHHTQRTRSASIAIALAFALCGGCATQAEPTADELGDVAATDESVEATPPDGARVGLPKSTLAFCQAACPAPDTCTRCVWQSNALDCDL